MYNPPRNVELQSIESKIDSMIIHTSDDPNRVHRFRETVLAVFEIIEKKLYKEKHQNIESYFKHHWNISRAQAYRLYNCGAIVQELSEFIVQPSRERYCRILKRITKTADERRKLWAEVVARTNGTESLISSSLITKIWEEMKGMESGSLSDNPSKINSVGRIASTFGDNQRIPSPPLGRFDDELSTNLPPRTSTPPVQQVNRTDYTLPNRLLFAPPSSMLEATPNSIVSQNGMQDSTYQPMNSVTDPANIPSRGPVSAPINPPSPAQMMAQHENQLRSISTAQRHNLANRMDSHPYFRSESVRSDLMKRRSFATSRPSVSYGGSSFASVIQSSTESYAINSLALMSQQRMVGTRNTNNSAIMNNISNANRLSSSKSINGSDSGLDMDFATRFRQYSVSSQSTMSSGIASLPPVSARSSFDRGLNTVSLAASSSLAYPLTQFDESSDKNNDHKILGKRSMNPAHHRASQELRGHLVGGSAMSNGMKFVSPVSAKSQLARTAINMVIEDPVPSSQHNISSPQLSDIDKKSQAYPSPVTTLMNKSPKHAEKTKSQLNNVARSESVGNDIQTAESLGKIGFLLNG